MAPRRSEPVYTPEKPFVKDVKRHSGSGRSRAEIGYEKMEIPEQFDAKFQLPRRLGCTAATMTDLYLPDKLVDEIVVKSNAYAKSNCNKRRYQVIKRKDVLNFLAVYQYMGLVRLPAKDDYFRTDGQWPTHPCLSGLTNNWFLYMFRYIHLVQTELPDVEEPLFVDLNGDPLEAGDDTDDEEEEEGDIEDCNVEREVDGRWYAKAAPLLDHFVNVSRRYACTHLFQCRLMK